MQEKTENISVSFDIEKVVDLGNSCLISTSDCWSRKMRLGCVHRVLGFFFNIKKGMTKHPGSLGKRNLSSKETHFSELQSEPILKVPNG